MLQRTNDPYFTTSCSDEFLKDLRNFIDETIVQQAAKYRLEYGMPPALKPLHRGEKRNGSADSTCFPHSSGLDHELTLLRLASAEHQLAIVNNKTKVTRKQIDEFLQLCWTKYVKSKVEPGAPRAFFVHASAHADARPLSLKRYGCRSYRRSVDR